MDITRRELHYETKYFDRYGISTRRTNSNEEVMQQVTKENLKNIGYSFT